MALTLIGLLTLYVALGVCVITGWLAAVLRYVDDELAPADLGGNP